MCIKPFSEFNNICSFWTTPVHTYPLYLLTPTLDWISKEPASFRSLHQAWACTVPSVGSEPPNPSRPAPSGAQGDGKHSPARATLRHVNATVFLCVALRTDLNHRMESLPGDQLHKSQGSAFLYPGEKENTFQKPYQWLWFQESKAELNFFKPGYKVVRTLL